MAEQGGQSRKRHEIIEPTDAEKAAANAARTFWRSFSRDSTALGIGAFAVVAIIVFAFAIGTLSNSLADGSIDRTGASWLSAIAALAAVAALALVAASMLVARHHHRHHHDGDLFAADGYLFRTSFIRDKKSKDGRGIVRIDVVPIAGCAGYHNEKDKTVWIVPKAGSRIHDVWRRGKRWEDERRLCLELLDSGIPHSADTDPFFGANEQYRGFLERIGVQVAKTTEPVDFIAGTWKPNNAFWTWRD